MPYLILLNWPLDQLVTMEIFHLTKTKKFLELLMTFKEINANVTFDC